MRPVGVLTLTVATSRAVPLGITVVCTNTATSLHGLRKSPAQPNIIKEQFMTKAELIKAFTELLNELLKEDTQYTGIYYESSW